MSIQTLVSLSLLGAVCSHGLRAQDSKLNTNLGAGVTAPLNPTGRLAGVSGNAVAGAGYNFDRRHSVVGQFMWAGLPPNREAFLAIREVTGLRHIGGSSNLFTLTGNYRFALQGHRYGTYLIGGGGLYYRHASLSREVTVGSETFCAPAWGWWGFRCVSGLVSEDETLFSAGSSVFGGNAGVGFTVRINEDGYKFYAEARYHYAPNRGVSTRIIPITFGFSW